MQQFSRDQNGRPMCIYPDRPQLQGPIKGNNLTPLQKQYNKAMSEFRASVEWVFGDIVNYFAFMDLCAWSMCTLSKCSHMPLQVNDLNIFRFRSTNH